MELMHANAVAVGDRGVLILGPPGAGKSSLSQALMHEGASLIADDYVQLNRHASGDLRLSPPKTIAGKMELRGLGVMAFPYVTDIPLRLLVRIELVENIERMPESPVEDIHGMLCPRLFLDPRQPFPTARIGAALRGQVFEEETAS